MGLKSKLSVLFARFAIHKRNKWANNPIKTTESDFKKLIAKGKKTAFGRDHDFESIESYDDFKRTRSYSRI